MSKVRDTFRKCWKFLRSKKSKFFDFEIFHSIFNENDFFRSNISKFFDLNFFIFIQISMKNFDEIFQIFVLKNSNLWFSFRPQSHRFEDFWSIFFLQNALECPCGDDEHTRWVSSGRGGFWTGLVGLRDIFVTKLNPFWRAGHISDQKRFVFKVLHISESHI